MSGGTPLRVDGPPSAAVFTPDASSCTGVAAESLGAPITADLQANDASQLLQHGAESKSSACAERPALAQEAKSQEKAEVATSLPPLDASPNAKQNAALNTSNRKDSRSRSPRVRASLLSIPTAGRRRSLSKPIAQTVQLYEEAKGENLPSIVEQATDDAELPPDWGENSSEAVAPVSANTREEEMKQLGPSIVAAEAWTDTKAISCNHDDRNQIQSSSSRSRSPPKSFIKTQSKETVPELDYKNSPFADTFARLKAHADARARGERPETPLRWTPKPSPLAMQRQREQPAAGLASLSPRVGSTTSPAHTRAPAMSPVG